MSSITPPAAPGANPPDEPSETASCPASTWTGRRVRGVRLTPIVDEWAATDTPPERSPPAPLADLDSGGAFERIAHPVLFALICGLLAVTVHDHLTRVVRPVPAPTAHAAVGELQASLNRRPAPDIATP